ncbi:MAG: hypothetical protein DMG61_24290 [Acidobacteria bacterium]|nr:MAG: hypothetical protein DMG61_24290 [Acidobacteriota bacterium]
MRPLFASGVLCALLTIVPGVWAKHHRHSNDSAQPGQFDYYLLSLSWAPNYCANHPGDHSNECKIGSHTTFVLHGLWPQANSDPPPISCSNASPVAAATVDHVLNFMPTRGLIQHEWQEHGTVAGTRRLHWPLGSGLFREGRTGLQGSAHTRSIPKP